MHSLGATRVVTNMHMPGPLMLPSVTAKLLSVLMLPMQGSCGKRRATAVLDQLATVRRAPQHHVGTVMSIETDVSEVELRAAQVGSGGVRRRDGSEQRGVRSSSGHLHAGVDRDVHHAAQLIAASAYVNARECSVRVMRRQVAFCNTALANLHIVNCQHPQL